MAPNWESVSLGLSWSLEVGLRVQKCVVVLLGICPSMCHISLRFPALLKGDAGANLLLIGFYGVNDRKRWELAHLYRL